MTKVLSFMGWLFISVLGRTLRVISINPYAVSNGNAAYAFWHGEQLIPCYLHRAKNAVIMASLSKDGEIQAGILNRLKYNVVRGSASRGAEKALVDMIRRARKGFDAGFAVDGPRGPYKEAKPGIVLLAKKCGIPVVPVSCCAKKRSVFGKAWDKYELPMPFSAGVAVYGEPLYIAGNDSVEDKTAELQSSLMELSEFTHKGYWSKDIKQYLAGHPSPRILIVQPSRIGDVVFTGPSVHAIRKKYPKAWIGWITDERCAPVLEGNKDIDEVIVFDRRKLSPGYIFNIFRYLRSKKIDLSLDFHGLAKSAFLVLLAGARFKFASASTNGMRELSWLFSKEIKPGKPDTHCVERHFAVAEYLGCDRGDMGFNFEAKKEDVRKIDNILTAKGILSDKPFAVIHPGGGWISRRWFPERFASLIDRLWAECGVHAVLVGGKEGGTGEKGLNEEILSKVNSKVIDLTGSLSIQELKAVIKKSGVFIANEAGPMHIAIALNAPTVAILGPTDPGRTGPYGGNTEIVRHIIECQPCRERNCGKRTCMELVTVNEVFEAAKRKLESVA